MARKIWDENTYPFLNFKGLHSWSLGMDKQFRPILYNGCYYLSMLGLKLIHVSKSATDVSKVILESIGHQRIGPGKYSCNDPSVSFTSIYECIFS